MALKFPVTDTPTGKIGFLTPDGTTMESAQRLIDSMKLDSVILADGRTHCIVEIGTALANEGVEIFVARGMSAVHFRQHLPHVSVISIPVSGQDLVQSIEEAKCVTGLAHPRIGLIAFPNIKADCEYFARLLGVDLRIYDLTEDNDPVTLVQRAKQDKVDIVIGGWTSIAEADRQGLKNVFLVSGDISLSIALWEAQLAASVREQEKANSQKFRAVLDLSREAVLLIDKRGHIEAANQVARSVLRPTTELVGKPASLFVPERAIRETLVTGKSSLDEIVSYAGGTLLFSIVPVRVEGKVSGGIISLQKTERISALDAKIRKSLLAKGMLSHYTFDSIEGISPQIERTIRLARKYSGTDKPVLIVGETGTGKELFAQAIHSHSQKRPGPFVAVNCSALPPTLLESELFGYEEGAFTGARRRGKPGLFELANGGTLFLDEVSEMDPYGQARLLRVLQERSSLRLGGDKYTAVTARIIAASNRDLYAEVKAGRFREDLFYRLNTLVLPVPPLRERTADIAYLIELFGTRRDKTPGNILTFPPDSIARLERHSWPGNVRELVSVVDRLTLLAEDGVVSLPSLEEALIPGFSQSDLEPDVRLSCDHEKNTDSWNESEREQLLAALAKAKGNQVVAAELLRVHRTTLYRKMRKYGIHKVLV